MNLKFRILFHHHYFLQGFETRGTEIHKRAWTLKNLNEHNNVDYFLMPNISIVLEELNIPQKVIGFGPFQQNSAQYHSKREERDLSSHNKLVGFGSCPGFICESCISLNHLEIFQTQ